MYFPYPKENSGQKMKLKKWQGQITDKLSYLVNKRLNIEQRSHELKKPVTMMIIYLY